MKKSQNGWENQPRLRNGEFTFRLHSSFFSRIVEKMLKKCSSKGKEEIDGGSYGELRKTTAGDKTVEIHHMPAASVSPLSRWKGPCIIMEKEEHKQTASYGNKKTSQEYREVQAMLIRQGKFFQAEMMDIQQIRQKFGGKYNKAIAQKIVYERKLEKEGKIK